jgi:hypothetical protein
MLLPVLNMKKPVIILSLTLALVAGIAVVERHQATQQENELHQVQEAWNLPVGRVQVALPQASSSFIVHESDPRSDSPPDFFQRLIDDAPPIPQGDVVLPGHGLHLGPGP